MLASLIVVGLLMCQGLRDLQWDEPNAYFPAILTALLMPLTFSITHGIAASAEHFFSGIEAGADAGAQP